MHSREEDLLATLAPFLWAGQHPDTASAETAAAVDQTLQRDRVGRGQAWWWSLWFVEEDGFAEWE